MILQTVSLIVLLLLLRWLFLSAPALRAMRFYVSSLRHIADSGGSRLFHPSEEGSEPYWLIRPPQGVADENMDCHALYVGYDLECGYYPILVTVDMQDGVSYMDVGELMLSLFNGGSRNLLARMLNIPLIPLFIFLLFIVERAGRRVVRRRDLTHNAIKRARQLRRDKN